jgi:hypothetical protein
VNESFRGVMKDETLVVLDRPAPLPVGTPVEVRALSLEAGSPEALLAAMEAAPHISAEDVAELEKAIAEGDRPPSRIDPFAEHRVTTPLVSF